MRVIKGLYWTFNFFIASLNDSTNGKSGFEGIYMFDFPRVGCAEDTGLFVVYLTGLLFNFFRVVRMGIFCSCFGSYEGFYLAIKRKEWWQLYFYLGLRGISSWISNGGPFFRSYHCWLGFLENLIFQDVLCIAPS